ncbi:MAG: molybdenum cofactor biosynthesis protein MoaE, partial [Candidatus Natronoplasma sp.]
MNDRVILKEDEVDLQKFKEKMIYDDTDALVTLTERARNMRKGSRVKFVKIESYGSTTKNSMHKIKDLIRKRFDINNIVIIQRLGTFESGDDIREILISAPDKG